MAKVVSKAESKATPLGRAMSPTILERGDPMRDCRFGCIEPSCGGDAVVTDVYTKSSVLSVVQISVLRTSP